MGDYEDFLGEDAGSKQRDAKYNIFKFQDHLKEVMDAMVVYSQSDDYDGWFKILRILYTRSRPFFDDEEKEDIKKKYEKTRDEKDKYLKYINEYKLNMNLGKKVKWNLQSTLTDDLHEFECSLFEYMGKHNLLMVMINKSSAGAASR